MADTDDYLQEGFDPRSVTVPRLRSILVTHNIDFPGTAKKPQLVELVNEYVLPQVPKLRAQRARAKRSSLGIVNAGSAQDDSNWADYELEAPTTTTISRRSMSPRKSSARVKREEEVEPTPFRSARKPNPRPASRQPSHFQEDEVPHYEPPKSARRSRVSVTPQFQAKPESESESESEEEQEPEEAPPAYEEEASVFTDDNPFQSRSSPAHLKTPTQRRRTIESESVRTERSVRHRADSHVEKTPIARPYGLPVTKTPRHRSPEFLLETLDPSEEFTPEAQLELEQAAANGKVKVMPRARPTPARKTSLTVPFFVLFITLLGAYSAWYRQEKIAVGYCGLGRPAARVIPPEIPVPDFLVPFVEPQCEACPLHAYCYQGFAVRCHNDFIAKPHPLSFGGLVPVPPTCEPDSEKARRVQAVAQRAIEELRERRARFECGELVDDAGQRVASPAIAEEQLKDTVSKKRNKRLNSAEFEDLWAAALGEITTRDEIIIEMEKTITEPASNSTDFPIRRLSSSSLARLPITCAFKRSIRLGLARYRFPIGLLMSLVLAILYLRARYRQHRAASAQVPALVDIVLERLANQKELGEEGLDDPWLFLPNLRDDVLRTIHSLKERERIWQKVKPVVELNSNVRTGQREGRSGEVGRAWEWIGPVRGDGARRRRSGRPYISESTPVTPEPKEVAPPATDESHRDIIQRRPIF
ncbi:Inner nuclear membrane SRC1-like protein [Cladobotryum mycophilum]|uniref:Inner nuclear membrane SRC1-like protein n=1 Tax=Cladobotryum mycophilum TaxID=491253 RepID=A0ABR0SF94_9HYPO